MYFQEAEVIELGLAEELIQDDLDDVNTEDTVPSKIKKSTAIYVDDAE